MDLWQKILFYYMYETINNKDFIDKIHINLDYIKNYNKKEEIVTNHDLILTTDLTELIEKYKKNILITTRLGCCESLFLLHDKFNTLLLNNNSKIVSKTNDFYMKQNTGLYYKNENDKKKVIDWWILNTIEIVCNSELTSSFNFLHYDLFLWSYLNLKQKFYNYGGIEKIVLKYSNNKKILYIGSAVESIMFSYNNKVYKKAWNFEVSNFSLNCVRTPQTTNGMDYPDDNIITTTYKIIDEIKNNHSDFDTAILGCGAYGPPIMNILSKIYHNKNLIYLGSSCYRMFGIYSHGMPIPLHDNDVNKNEWIPVIEKFNIKYKNIDGGKYWSK